MEESNVWQESKTFDTTRRSEKTVAAAIEMQVRDSVNIFFIRYFEFFLI